MSAARRRQTWAVVRITVIGVLMVLFMRLTGCAESFAFYHPTREKFATPQGVEDVEFVTADGVRLHGWFVPARGLAPGARAPAVIHAHGNAGNVSGHLAFSEFLPDDGVSVLVFDYRGFGRSQNARRLQREQLMIDTRAAFAYLRARPDVDAERIGAYGVSLGAVFALGLAAEEPGVRSVALVAPFGSWRGIASHHAPVLGSLMIGPGLDPEELVERVGGREVLIVHGGDDGIVPARQSEAIERNGLAAGVTVTRIVVPDGDHNGLLFDHPEAAREIAEFFLRTLGR